MVQFSPYLACRIKRVIFSLGTVFFCVVWSSYSFCGDVTSATAESARMSDNGVTQDSRMLTFMGIVEPGRSFRVILQPGESIKKISVANGEKITQGQVVAQLTSDSLTNARFDLLQKQNMVFKERQQLELIALETDIRERQLKRIDHEIGEERRLTSQVDGYISTVTRQLENEKLRLSGELEIIRMKLRKMEENIERLDVLAEIVKKQLAEIAVRQKMLLVRAPYGGEVVFISPDTVRTPPGSIVCEIWSDSSYRIRGKIMQHQVKLIQVGDTVEFSLDFSDSKSLEGKVSLIQQSMGGRENPGGYPSFDVLVQADSTVDWVRPGMMVSMKKRVSGK